MRSPKRILFFPNTNTLSHLGRAFTIAGWMEAEGFETHIGISSTRRAWASRFHPRCHTVRELWEPSGIPFPCLQWFDDRNHIEACAASQEKVIREVKPDLIIAVFDFISALSSRGIPRVCINGACMLPAYRGVLGFDDCVTPERTEQSRLFHLFWAFAGRSFQLACARRNHPAPSIANDLLEGTINLIYEIPQICRLQHAPASYHLVGPIGWEGWEQIGENVPWRRDKAHPVVYVNSGTFPLQQYVMETIKEEVLSAGLRVLMSGGRNGDRETSSRFFRRQFLSPSAAMRLSDLVICTGGTGVCYMNLLHGVPSLVFPMQPEQASNGIDLQQAACGRVATYNLMYYGDTERYARVGNLVSVRKTLHAMLDDPGQFYGLERVSQALRSFPTRELVIQHIQALQ